jgi:hypothetical protein
MSRFAAILVSHIQNGTILYENHPFWTTQHSYARLEELAPELYEQLSRAELVIFKSDLNYRKLVFDGLWPHTTPFRHAIGTLGLPSKTKNSGLRILSLRTCKADTCVGLQEGREKEIDPLGNKEWTRTGKYAVVSYCDNKAQA